MCITNKIWKSFSLRPRTSYVSATKNATKMVKQGVFVRSKKVPFQSVMSKQVYLETFFPSYLRNSGYVCQTSRRSYSNSVTNKDNKDLSEKVQHTNISNVDNSDDDSFRNIIYRFKKLEKDSKSDDIDDVISKAEKLTEVFLGLTALPNVREKMVENLNTILNFYDLLDASCDFNKLVSQMKSLLIANETTYYLYIRHQMKTRPWVDGLQTVETMKKKGIDIHARTYYHIILNALRTGNQTDALAMMQEMKELQNVFHDDFYKLLFDTAFAMPRETQSFVFSSLDLLKDTGFVLGPKSFGSLKRWFESDKRAWTVGTSLVNLRGVCKCCGVKLKKFSLPYQRRIVLQEKLKSIAENAIVNNNGIHRSKVPLFGSSSKNDQSVKVHALKHYIENNGPFDIALDVLNAAYFRDRGFNSFQVKRVVRHFKSMGKHVLALCSSPLLSSLLKVDAAPNLPNYHMIQLLHYLRRQQCGIFFVDDTKEDGHIDDHFILLSMVFQNMDIDIVTADKFGDHVDSLDTSTRRDFQRWMRAHQIVLHTFTENGLPKFRRREHFDTDIQSNKTSWHIPGPNKQWLCCNRR